MIHRSPCPSTRKVSSQTFDIFRSDKYTSKVRPDTFLVEKYGVAIVRPEYVKSPTGYLPCGKVWGCNCPTGIRQKSEWIPSLWKSMGLQLSDRNTSKVRPDTFLVEKYGVAIVRPEYVKSPTGYLPCGKVWGCNCPTGIRQKSDRIPSLWKSMGLQLSDRNTSKVRPDTFLVEKYGVAFFSMDHGILEKYNHFLKKPIFLSFEEKFTFSNVCAIQLNLPMNC